MKILFDFRIYKYFNERGVGRGIYDLIKNAAKCSEEDLYMLLDRDSLEPKFPAGIRKRITSCYLDDFQRGRYQDGEFDVYINTLSFFCSLGAADAVTGQYPPSVLRACRKWTCILHDYIPLFFPEYVSTESSKTGFVLQMEAMRHLDHIFTNSRFTTACGVRYTGLDKSRFTCIYGGADEEKFRTKNTALPYGESERGPHLVYVSGAAPQKNNIGFVKAFCKTYREGRIPENAKLYLLGQADEGYKARIRYEVERLGCKYGKQVFVTGYIPEEEMLELVGTARANMFPSYLEGLGLPILEGYAAGTPCFASGLTATREFVLKECTFDPFDEDSMMDAIALAYRDDELCARSLEFGRKLLKEINWENGARVLLDKCRELSGEMVGEG